MPPDRPSQHSLHADKRSTNSLGAQCERACHETSLEALVRQIARHAAREIYRRSLKDTRRGEQDLPGS